MEADDGGTILALDVGSARIGMARASMAVRLAAPAGTLQHTGDVTDQLKAWCAKERVSQLVIGLPRGMDGQETAQTASVQEFGDKIGRELNLPIHWQDEAVTSIRAEEELQRRGKPYRKEDIDALAATYILEDYLHESV